MYTCHVTSAARSAAFLFPSKLGNCPAHLDLEANAQSNRLTGIVKFYRLPYPAVGIIFNTHFNFVNRNITYFVTNYCFSNLSFTNVIKYFKIWKLVEELDIKIINCVFFMHVIENLNYKRVGYKNSINCKYKCFFFLNRENSAI